MRKTVLSLMAGLLLPLMAVEVNFSPGSEGKGFLTDSIADFDAIVGKMAGKNGGAPEISVTVSPEQPFGIQDGLITVGNGKIAIQASSGLGASNALYKLLDLWGCRFIVPGELGEVIPENADFKLPEGKIPVTISFDTRVGAQSGTPHFNLWRKRNLRSNLNWLTAQHYWFYAMPPSKYFAEHPEYYALIGGKRVPTQLCVSNPEVRDLMAKIAVENIKSRPSLQSFPMDPEDNFEHCQCPECEKLDGEAVYFNGYKNVTNRVADFANHVARHLQTAMPGMMVGFYGYANKKLPPTIELEENVYVPMTRDSSCLLHLRPNDQCPSGKDFWELLTRWQAKNKSFMAVYEYDPISWIGGLPCPIYLERAHAIKLQHQMGVKGVVNDSGPVRDSANFVNCYLEIRQIADATRIPEKELEEMCLAYFGPKAGPLMNQYYLTLAKVTDNHLDLRFGIDGYEKIFTPAIMSESRRLLDDALLSVPASDEKVRRRLRVVELEQQYLEAFINFFNNIGKKDLAASKNDIDKIYLAIDNLAANPDANFNDPADAKRRIKNSEMKTFARVFPDEMGFIRNWQVAGPFENPNRDALIVAPEPAFREGKLYLDGKETKLTSYQARDGFVDLRFAMGDLVKADMPYYYYAVTEFDSKVAGAAQLRIDSFNPFKVYLNGSMVFERKGLDEDCPDKRVVPVQLKGGKNIVIVLLDQHVTSMFANAGFWLRFTKMNGQLIQNRDDASDSAELDSAQKLVASGKLVNLVPNPSMENIGKYQDSTFGMWPPASAAGCTVDTSKAFDGKQSIRFTGIASASLNRFFPVKPGERYLVALRYAPGDKAQSGGCVLDIGWRGNGKFNDNPDLNYAFFPVNHSGDWQEIAGVVTVPAGQDQMVYAVSISGQKPGEFANIDQLQLFRLP